VGSLTCAPTIPPGKLQLISDPQQILPLTKVTLEAHALRDPKRRNDATFDCLAALSRSLARKSKFPPRPVEVSRKSVMLVGLNLGQQLLDDLLHLSESRNERHAVHIVIFHDIRPRRTSIKRPQSHTFFPQAAFGQIRTTQLREIG
jgi:hypothetical protein